MMWSGLVLVASCLCGQTSPPAEAEKSARFEVIKRAAAAYELAGGGADPVPLTRHPEPLLRWTNPLRKTGDGAVFLWTDAGRPRAVACIYTYKETGIDHEFQSLSEQPLTAKFRGEPVWHPDAAGLAWKPLPDAPAPAKSPALRLVQMRGLARRFTASVGQESQENRQELRLLTQPVYRYGDGTAPVIDGAIFAFVQGTDPEVLLLFEADTSGSGTQWRYALARMSSVRLDVRYQDADVWSVPRWDWKPDPDDTYITFVRQREPRE